jgi:hypothetical protein
VDHKTIGNLNGPWALLLKVHLALAGPVFVLVVSALSWLFVNQIKDNEFREIGPRLTPEMQSIRDRAMVSEIVTLVHAEVQAHEMIGGHAVMANRVDALERRADSTDAVEREETELIRRLVEVYERQCEWERSQNP